MPCSIQQAAIKQSMLLPDRRKLILDLRAGTFEIYDLKTDPTESVNLYDSMGAEGVELMRRLQDFFDVHRIRKPGYKVPYRR